MIDINNSTKFKFNRKSFSQVAKKVLSGENRERETISLAFVSQAQMRKLNKQFRHKDKPTDVLSFNLNDSRHLGEIVICPEFVRDFAKEQKVSFDDEMVKVFVHGVLHLLGYDHELSKKEEARMFKKQDYYLKRIKWPKAT